jgi:hypothetical protein
MRKLDLHAQTELVRFAAQHGLTAAPIPKSESHP